jgi:uncharacterized membrane protein YkvA (DUF1232 family)
MTTEIPDWERLKAAYPTMLRECEARVARWAFAPIDADWESPYALWEARRGTEPRSREVSGPGEPEGWRKIVQYGFDVDGSILVARRFTVIKGIPRVSDEVLWATVDGHRTHILRTYPPFQDVIMSCAVPHREGEIVHGVETWTFDGEHRQESYTYEGGRLTHIALDDGERYRVGYGEDGNLAVIWASNPEDDEGRESVVYRRKNPGDIARARKQAVPLLCDGVRAWARRQPVSGTVRVLVIGYDLPPNDVLPPPLGLGQTDDAVVAEVAAGAHAASLFSVADQGIFDPVPEEFSEDIDAFQRLNQEWRSTSDDAAGRRLLLTVAKRLNEQDWTAVFPRIAEDFIVVPVDVELGDLERNLTELGVHRDGD